ncbi:forkhead box protein O-like [Oppia nitens]|uniref:forkhead box protein O-like n=1 Tax=Oppia nitens TaxID=1686743 RepID=UPI0023DAA18D|nr:forkhead box protein O-like [Oppia nitens]
MNKQTTTNRELQSPSQLDLDLDWFSLDQPFRSRSHTWPLKPKPDSPIDEEDEEVVVAAESNNYNVNTVLAVDSKLAAIMRELEDNGSRGGAAGDQQYQQNGGQQSLRKRLLTVSPGSAAVVNNNVPDFIDLTTTTTTNCRDTNNTGATIDPPMSMSSTDSSGMASNSSGNEDSKKSRLNPWGVESYAELITRAINESPDRRLRLSQVYDWIVDNVPYFKDKGTGSSSGGWKNSVRHNLSLYTRFKRLPNECTGQSSWWTLNDELATESASSLRNSRRRASSLDTHQYKKARDRVKKKLETLREVVAVSSSTPNRTSSLKDLPDTIDTSSNDTSILVQHPELRHGSQETPLSSSQSSGGGGGHLSPAMSSSMGDNRQISPVPPLISITDPIFINISPDNTSGGQLSTISSIGGNNGSHLQQQQQHRSPTLFTISPFDSPQPSTGQPRADPVTINNDINGSLVDDVSMMNDLLVPNNCGVGDDDVNDINLDLMDGQLDPDAVIKQVLDHFDFDFTIDDNSNTGRR